MESTIGSAMDRSSGKTGFSFIDWLFISTSVFVCGSRCGCWCVSGSPIAYCLAQPRRRTWLNVTGRERCDRKKATQRRCCVAKRWHVTFVWKNPRHNFQMHCIISHLFVKFLSMDKLIAILQNNASPPICQNVKYCVRNLCRASARLQISSLSFALCQIVLPALFYWIAIIFFFII